MLDAFGFLFHKELGILICRHRDGAQLPHEAPGHAHKAHGVPLTEKAREDFIQYCATNSDHIRVHDQVGSVPIPTPKGPPVHKLKVGDGFACIGGDGLCTYCCCSEGVMKKHIRVSHDIRLPKKVVDYYHSATVQTLFHVTNRAYFQVLPQLENIPIENPFHQVLQEYTPALSILPPPIAGPDTERERTPFMRIMDWDHHLSRFLTDKESLDRILSLQQAPTPGEVYEKAHFSMLTAAVLEYIQEGIRICRQESQGFTVRQKLVHGEVLPSKPSY